jgi:hypothetical protein
MGQPVSVTQKPSITPGRVRFELNRSLTGQGHERYTAAVTSRTGKPSDVLANRFFETGTVSAKRLLLRRRLMGALQLVLLPAKSRQHSWLEAKQR